MLQYTSILVQPYNNPETLLVVLKDRPLEQAGKFNLIGGKVETGETLEQAAIREMKEESGFHPSLLVPYGILFGDWGEVHYFKTHVEYNFPCPRPEETELVSWVSWMDLKDSENLIVHLKIIIPLMLSGVKGWKVMSNWNTLHSDSIRLYL